MSQTIAAPPATLARLAKLGLKRRDDLVTHLPLRYEDETRIVTIADAGKTNGAVQVEAEVLSNEIKYRPRRQLIVRVADDSGELFLRFLNFYGSQVKQMAVGTRLRIIGERRPGFFGDEMVHPKCRVVQVDTPLPTALTPVYPTTAGLPQATLRRLIGNAITDTALSETLPEKIQRNMHLVAFDVAVKKLHYPQPSDDSSALMERTHSAWRRIKFDELLAQQLSLRRAYRARRARTAPKLPPRNDLTTRLLQALPFKLTGAQQRVGKEIAADLSAAHPMQRLLLGDVGSGKTIVAALAALQAIENGYQAALMAPTEILAEQHYRKLSGWLTPLGINIIWLSGSLKKKEKTAAQEHIASGHAHLAIGTHALIQGEVTFAKLGLALIDEQHRFGVQQRLQLRQKGAQAHQLMMSATPIPRTLSMTYYADLDVSVIDELPPGRKPVTTKLVSEARRDEVLSRVREAIRSGRQTYWVCPLIEESEALQLKTAEETFATLTEQLPDIRVGLVHGRLKPAEKAAVMASFVTGETQLLVATTVIEVGVDVPNAVLMVIEHAERFGLAQLHQLRGRVGRGAAKSACILLYQNPLSEMARARLKVIYENTDGFEIARLDLELRGPGEFIGSRQSGAPLLRFADLVIDAELVDAAQKCATLMLDDYPDLATAHLQRWLGSKEELLKA